MTTETADMRPVSGPEAAYFLGLDQGIFRIQRCGACARHVFYPRVLCPHCGNAHLTWTEPSGKGKVYSVSVIYGKPGTGSDYNVALIDLEEGVRVMSRVEGLPPEEVRIGMAVRAEVRVADGKGLLVFKPGEQK